jgi:hypothetical protein
MMRGIMTALVLAMPTIASAQDIEVTPLEDSVIGQIVPAISQTRVNIAEAGVTVRALDKVSGEVVDFDLEPGRTKQLGRIKVSLGECRYPAANPNGDAFAYLRVFNFADDQPIFAGWMIASSPALNALDHARYDVWPLRCITPSGD